MNEGPNGDPHQASPAFNTEFSLAWPRIRPLLKAESARHMEESMRRLPALDLWGYIEGAGKRHGIIRDWREFQERYPALLGPVTSEIAGDVDAIGEVTERSRTVLGLCAASTFVGIPAVSAPTGLSRGMPVGVQIIEQHFREEVCLPLQRLLKTA